MLGWNFLFEIKSTERRNEICVYSLQIKVETGPGIPKIQNYKYLDAIISTYMEFYQFSAL